MQSVAWWMVLVLLSHCFLFAPFANAQSLAAADLLIFNAKVWTVDSTHPTAQAVAVLRDRIVTVGSNSDAEA